MEPGEIAAQISAERDVHVDCVLETLEGLKAMGLDPERLVRFGPVAPAPPTTTVHIHLEGPALRVELAELRRQRRGWWPR